MNSRSARSSLNQKTKTFLPFLIIVLLFTVITAACGDGANSSSKILPRKTFIKLMAEVEIVASFQNYSNDSAAAARLQDSVFAHYNVSEKEFRATEHYYQQRPEIYKAIIDSALEHFSQTQAQLSGIQNNPKD